MTQHTKKRLPMSIPAQRSMSLPILPPHHRHRELIEEVTECNRDVTLTIQRGLSRATAAVVLCWMKSSGLNSSTMSRFLFSVYAIALVFFCTLEPWAQALQQNSQANDWMRVPGTAWERAKPESLGYSSARLEALRGWLKTQQTDAMMVVVHGKVISSTAT